MTQVDASKPAAATRRHPSPTGALRRLILASRGPRGRAMRALCASGLFLPLLGLVGVLGLLALSSAQLALLARASVPQLVAHGLLLALGITLIGVMLYRVHHHLVRPLAGLREWAAAMRAGELHARVELPRGGGLSELARDINALSERFERLSLDMDQEVRRQTERIKQKNRSLEILYDVAASINTARDLDDLLKRFLVTLAGLVNAHAATVRLATEDGQLRLVASHGLDESRLEGEQLVPVERCLCGESLQQGELLVQRDLRRCDRMSGQKLCGDPAGEMIAIPLQYRGRNLGVYNLFVDQRGLVEREDVRELLTSIGRHLGMAIDKARLDEQSKRLSILQERSMLSSELHDSLAQTLASLRFQVRMLDDSLQRGESGTAAQEVVRLQHGIDEAYTELRELLAHFRAPFDERGLVDSVEALVQRFREETGTLILFQNEWQDSQLPSPLQMQVLRIVQEALQNIRKHARAHAVRILLRSDGRGQHTVLIEDDGVGIGEPVFDGAPGEHIGLSIMRERARRLGGELRIESDPGEGTRLTLSFNTGNGSQQALPGLQS